MKASVRCDALDMAGLIRQEKHGKREDKSSMRRRIREADPLVYRGLDLVDLFTDHMDGVKQNKAAKKPVLHFIIRYPPEVLADNGPPAFATLTREEREERMLNQAIQFINDNHGGRAVFAARVDKDEAGETVVDVFASPLYEKTNVKRRSTEIWASATKFGKEVALRHQEEIRRRLPEAVAVLKDKEGGEVIPITTPRAVGMALQTEFAGFFFHHNGAALAPKKEKEKATPDRLGVEEWKTAKDAWDRAEAESAAQVRDAEEARDVAAAEAAQAVLDRDQARDAEWKAATARDQALTKARAAITARDQAKADQAAAVVKVQKITGALNVLAREIEDETIGRGDQGQIIAKDQDGLRDGFPDLKPAVIASADAMAAKKKLEAEAKADREKAKEALKSAEDTKTEISMLRDTMNRALSALKLGLKVVDGFLNKKSKDDINAKIKEAEDLITRSENPGEDSGRFSM